MRCARSLRRTRSNSLTLFLGAWGDVAQVADVGALANVAQVASVAAWATWRNSGATHKRGRAIQSRRHVFMQCSSGDSTGCSGPHIQRPALELAVGASVCGMLRACPEDAAVKLTHSIR
jgi:hypothetical protein